MVYYTASQIEILICRVGKQPYRLPTQTKQKWQIMIPRGHY